MVVNLLTEVKGKVNESTYRGSDCLSLFRESLLTTKVENLMKKISLFSSGGHTMQWKEHNFEIKNLNVYPDSSIN